MSSTSVERGHGSIPWMTSEPTASTTPMLQTAGSLRVAHHQLAPIPQNERQWKTLSSCGKSWGFPDGGLHNKNRSPAV